MEIARGTRRKAVKVGILKCVSPNLVIGDINEVRKLLQKDLSMLRTVSTRTFASEKLGK